MSDRQPLAPINSATQGQPVGLYNEAGVNQAVANVPAQPTILPANPPRHVPGGRRQLGPANGGAPNVDPNGLYIEGRTSGPTKPAVQQRRRR